MVRYLPHTSCLILMMGVAGTGKSTLSREIIRRICAVYLDNNHVADAFFPDTRSSLKYQRLRSRFYKALYTITKENLKLGNSVLLDVPHVKDVQSREWRDFIKELVKQTETKLITIRCLCSESSLRARLSSRGERRDEWKLKHWKKFLTQEPIKVPIPFPHLNIDTEQSFRRSANTAIRYIEKQMAKSFR